MAKKKLDMIKNIFFFIIIIFSFPVYSDSNLDQWRDSNKTYKDLIDEGFEVKSYDTATLSSDLGFTILLFITVLQKDKEVFECQEYQTIDDNMQTLDLSLVCRELTQPYNKGIGT